MNNHADFGNKPLSDFRENDCPSTENKVYTSAVENSFIVFHYLFKLPNKYMII